MKFAEVILPLPLEATFTYSVPKDLEEKVEVGHRVIVPFGRKNKYYTAIVVSVTTLPPETRFEIKEILMAIDHKPVVIHPQLRLWNWIADYYMCSQGDVFKAALPTGLKIESETFVEINPDFEFSEDFEISEKEKVIVETLLTKGKSTVDKIENLTGLKRIGPIIAKLIDEGIVIVSERLIERYKPKKEHFIELSPEYQNDLDKIFAAIKGAPKQEKLLMTYLHLTSVNEKGKKDKAAQRKDLLEKSEINSSILTSLIKKGVFRQFTREINRFKYTGSILNPLPVLSGKQNEALNLICESWKNVNVTLFRGVTSSGKTEIYQHLISKILQVGDEALLLVPEIALTTQLTRRMQAVFGEKVLIYHSKFSDAERVEIWKKIIDDKGPRLIIGARSAVFLPFRSLKLVIVDEEHESSYKQVEPAPRYQARDVAILLASMHGAKTLLGSATPSIESYWKALNGKFALVELLQRYKDVKMPAIRLVDMTKSYREGTIAGPYALTTLKEIREKIESGSQIIIFQNRRGFAPVARCGMCAWVPKCDRCDVAMTYHKHNHSLVCHYCGAVKELPKICPQCKQPSVTIHGYGTERVEEEISMRLPNARIARMDLDTTRNKENYERIIEDFSNGNKDILVGTQMVTKGLDFGGVSTVVVLNADTIINFPDFKSRERAFNMLEQVSGRSGRREDNEGQVIFQTFNPEENLFRHLIKHDYKAFYNDEILEREKFLYPPFTRIINVYLKHPDLGELTSAANHYAEMLRQTLGERVYGPEEPLVSRIQNYYIRRLMLKIEPDASMPMVKKFMRDVLAYLYENKEMRGIVVYFDVDPS